MLQFDHSEEQSGLQVDEMAKAYLLEVGRWAKFIAIFGFIVFGLMLFGGLAMLMTESAMVSGIAQASGMSAGGMAIMYIILSLIYLFPLLALFRFSNWVKRAVNNEDTDQLSTALRYLKNHFRYIGIILIAVVSLYVLMFLFLLVVGGVAAISS